MNKVILCFLVFFITFGIGYGVNARYFSGRRPTQPIAFSHRIHAGDNDIPCLYCHIYAEHSRISGVPNVKKCMGCHAVIKKDSVEIQKIASYWEGKEPIPWVKVHNLEDVKGGRGAMNPLRGIQPSFVRA
ncbi:MAG: cytochrome c3 family protein [Thermodesulfobacteriota bacterium]